MKNLNSSLSFIFPSNDKYAANILKRDLIKRFGKVEVIPVFGASSFFEAWKSGLKQTMGKYIVFTHQDVIFYKFPNFDNLFRDNTGLVGVAGSTEITIESPWWFDEERYRLGKLSGNINYWDPRRSNTSIKYGEFKEVVVLDGVCLITKREILEKVGIPKTKWCKWDFYDHVFSLEYIMKGYKLITAPINMLHFSTGGGRLNFEKSQNKFTSEYFQNKKIWSTCSMV